MSRKRRDDQRGMDQVEVLDRPDLAVVNHTEGTPSIVSKRDRQMNQSEMSIVRSITYRPHVRDTLCKVLDDLYQFVEFQYADVRRIDYNTDRLLILVHKIRNREDSTKMDDALPGYSYLGNRTPRIKDGITGHVALTEQKYYAPDVNKDPFYNRYRVETQSAVALPLKLGGDMLGVLLLEADRINAFEATIEWLESIAVYVAATLQRERQELIETEWGHRYDALIELNQLIANSFDLDQLIKDMAGSIQNSIEGCDLCSFSIYDNDKKRFHIRGSQEDNRNPSTLKHDALIDAEKSISGDVLRLGDEKFVPSLEDDDHFQRKDWARQEGYYAALFLPLYNDEVTPKEPLGCVILYTKSPDATVLKNNIVRVQQIARAVAGAFTRLNKTLPYGAFMETIEECNQSATPTQRHTLEAVLAIAKKRTNGCYGSIFLTKSGESELTLAATTGISTTEIENVAETDYGAVIYKMTEAESSRHRTSRVALTKKSVRILNQESTIIEEGEEIQFDEPLTREVSDQRKESESTKHRGFLAVPIQSKDPVTGKNRCFGVIRVFYKKNGLPFTPVDQLVLEAIGRALGLSMMSAERIATGVNMLARIGKHNLLTPVVQARDNCGYLLEHPNLPPDQLKQKLRQIGDELEQAHDGIEILASITDTQNESYRTIQPTAKVDLIERLERIARMLKEMARLRQAEFKIDFKEDNKPIVLGDKKWLDRAFYELLYNAVKHSTPPSNITVTLIRNGEFWRVLVHNKGKALPPDEVRQLWERAPSAPSSSANSRSKDHGYGLNDMREIIQRHRGTAGLASRPLISEDNQFADWQFFIELPVVNQSTASQTDTE